jgi:hypothetical protein
MSEHNSSGTVVQANKDRAAVVASTIFWLIADAVRDWFAGAPIDRATIERPHR